MSWTAALYFLSFLSLSLGIYLVYMGRRSGRILWILPLTALDVAIWIAGVAVAMESRSPLTAGVSITIIEIAINTALPLITWYQVSIVNTGRFIRRILWPEIFIAILIIILVVFRGYRRVEYVNGEISLILVKNPAFYLALFFSIVSPLLNIFIAVWMAMLLGYKRDLRQCIYWAVGFSIGIVWLVIRFYFPVTYKYGCFIVFTVLINGCLYNVRYRPAVTSMDNLANNIYYMAKIPLLVLARDGKILLANNSAHSFFQKNRAELTGMDIKDILDFGEKTPVFAKTASAGNQINRIEGRARNNNATCEIDITCIYDKYKEFYRAILFISDITDRINLIGELEEAKRRAELANQAKTVFLANTSHEIRTPMNAIVGMSELILRENISPEVYEYTMGIKQAGENLLSIINDILDFSKIESGKMEILPVNYHLSSLVNNVINIVRVRAVEKSLVFISNIDSALPNDLVGDEVRIRQVLLNLLGNAVKYTEQGYIKLSIAMERDGNSADMGGNPANRSFMLRIDVEDCGVGIKEEDLGKVFGEFVQVDMTANRSVEGTGLGLSIAKRLCKAMDGDITVHSVYGKGSVFTVRIPQKARSDKCFASVKDPGEMAVLIYENRTANAGSLCWSLDNLGVSYTLAVSEEAFLEALRGEGDRKKYAFVFAAQALYGKTLPRLEAGKLDSRLVLLADYGSEAGIRNISFLTMPAHTLSIAGILNHKMEQGNAPKKGNAVKFTAPSARVLIVDDIATNLKVAQALLLPYNMKIDICTSGPLSIELVKKNKYDLVFMDHMMPGMDGIEATAAIRAWEKERQGQDAEAGVPVVALTANAVSGMKEMFLQRGFDDYLAKPIELPKLQGILEKWLPAGKQIKEGGAAPQPALGRLPAEPGESFLSEETNHRRNAMDEQKAKKIVLAVDDMPPNLAAIRTILGNDYDIRLAKSPLAALGMLNTTRVDLILLDVEMPEMSGFEFLERLRGNSGIEQPPVIFVTSHETPDVTARALSGGAGYVVKPIVPRVLLEKVRSVLEPR